MNFVKVMGIIIGIVSTVMYISFVIEKSKEPLRYICLISAIAGFLTAIFCK